jgi:hypothetical protein
MFPKPVDVLKGNFRKLVSHFNNLNQQKFNYVQQLDAYYLDIVNKTADSSANETDPKLKKTIKEVKMKTLSEQIYDIQKKYFKNKNELKKELIRNGFSSEFIFGMNETNKIISNEYTNQLISHVQTKIPVIGNFISNILLGSIKIEQLLTLEEKEKKRSKEDAKEEEKQEKKTKKQEKEAKEIDKNSLKKTVAIVTELLLINKSGKSSNRRGGDNKKSHKNIRKTSKKSNTRKIKA